MLNKVNLSIIFLIILLVAMLIPIGIISTIVVSWIALYITKKLKFTGYRRLLFFLLIVYCITLGARLPGIVSDLIYASTKEVNKISKITKIKMNQRVFLSTNSFGMRFVTNYFITKKVLYDFLVHGGIRVSEPSHFYEKYIDELKEKPIVFTKDNKNTNISIIIKTKTSDTHEYIDIKILENNSVNARYTKRFRKTSFLGQYDNIFSIMFTTLFEDNIYNLVLQLIKPTDNKNQFTPIMNFINNAIEVVPDCQNKSIALDSKIIKIDSSETFYPMDIIDKYPWHKKDCKNRIRFKGRYESTINAKKEDVFMSIKQKGGEEIYVSIAPVYKKSLLVRPSLIGLYCSENGITVILRAYNVLNSFKRLPFEIWIMKVDWDGRIISNYNSVIYGLEDIERKSYISTYFIKFFKETEKRFDLILSYRMPESLQEKNQKTKLIKLGKQYFIEIIKP